MLLTNLPHPADPCIGPACEEGLSTDARMKEGMRHRG